ncbi:hypothetical protein [Streptomyces sp. HUAS ZL42]|uniref:hypothetical protein n=1 Tax=Streptomyces sp. HUAS ZL42 TaxID=3231715 RepID=UPI00345E78ED
MELPKPLTVIFGLNGSGKTRLLSSLSKSLSDAPVVAMYELVNYLLHDFGKRDDIPDLLDELDPLAPEKVKLDEVQDLVRRDYEEVRWYVAPIVGSPFSALVGEEVVPVFVVRYGGREYDFRSMGLGELSVHLLMWILSYSKGSDSQAFLLDEPEAFLPAPSKAAFLAHLLETCINGGKPLVVASHSLEVIQPALDADAAIMLAYQSSDIQFIGPSDMLKDRVAGLYGQTREVEWVVLLEDEAAYILIQEITRTADPKLWQSCRFLWCAGYGDLEAIWAHLPRPDQKIDGVPSFAFVADGDKAEDVKKAVAKNEKKTRQKNRWPLFCLPGDPDALMKASAKEQVSFLADHLSQTPEAIVGFLESIEGREAHNWLEDFVSFARRPRQEVMRMLSMAYVRNTDRAELQDFLSSLK